VQLRTAPSFSSNWIGTGTFDLWFISVTNTHYYIYKMTVSITGTLTTVPAVTTATESGTLASLSSGDITYSVTPSGSPNTTAINFSFSASVTGLSTNDITITNGTGSATKGSLSGSGTSWSLGVTAGSAGTVTVKINKTGIESASKPVTISKGGSSCDVIPTDLHGTWNWASGGHSITSVVSATTLQITETGGTAANNGTFTLTVSDITPVTNTGANAATFPSGYTLTGTITSSTVTSKPSGTPNVSFTVYLNAGKTQFFETGDSRTFTKAGGDANPFAGTAWLGKDPSYGNDLVMTFTATNWTLKHVNIVFSEYDEEGTYTYNGDEATLMMTDHGDVGTAYIYGNSLNVYFEWWDPEGRPYSFGKQP
jgi:hypothetical protein